jgi:hypothetical protein
MTRPSPSPREITIDDFDILASALILSESEVDDLCDSFTERCVDVQHRGIGHANARLALPHDAQELLV